MTKTAVPPHVVEEVKAIKPKKFRWWRWLGCLLLLLLLMVCGGMYTVYHIYQTRLKPQAGEWTYTLPLGSYQVPVSVSGAIRLSTTPFWGKLLAKGLAGKERPTRLGTFSLGWDSVEDSLIIQCTNCEASIEGVNAQSLRVAQIRLLVHQVDEDNFSGRIFLGLPPYQIELPWRGELSAQNFNLQIYADNVALNAVFQNLASGLPELQRARITGTISLEAALTLPSLGYTFTKPEIKNFTVSGLGTEQLRYARSACGEASNLPMNSWLVRSVISAEDQRFEQHPGYDLHELMLAYNENVATGGIVRGGSTISQQTAKILFTGPERSYTRKLQELLYAVEMERTLGKARIMQLYLDNALWGLYPDGQLLCGAHAAAEHYFQTTPDKLKPEQAIWLAAMLHSPVTEQRDWKTTGKINLKRAVWIAQFVRNAPNSGPRARQKVIRSLQKNPSLGMKITKSKKPEK